MTGANRGIGQALVAEALRRGAKQVLRRHAQPLAHPDERVTPVALDVTDPAQIRTAAEQIGSLDILINNAGVQPFDDLSDVAPIEQALAVNLFGTYRVIQGLLPMLTRSRGAIVNNLSLLALAPLPLVPAYSVSKAAAFSMTQFAAGPAGGPWRAGARRPDRPDGHRHDPGPGDTEGFPGIGRQGHLRRRRTRGGGHLPRPHDAVYCRRLARRRGQDT